MPLACPEPVPSAPEDVVYGIGRIDASGRIADRAVTSALGVNQLAAQACQALAHAVAWAMFPVGALRCPAVVAGCRVVGDAPTAGPTAPARTGRDMTLIQVQAGRPW
jgi:hypothetical protein